VLCCVALLWPWLGSAPVTLGARAAAWRAQVKVPMSRLLKLNGPEWLTYGVAGLAGSAVLGFMFPGFALAFSSILAGFVNPDLAAMRVCPSVLSVRLSCLQGSQPARSSPARSLAFSAAVRCQNDVAVALSPSPAVPPCNGTLRSRRACLALSGEHQQMVRHLCGHRRGCLHRRLRPTSVLWAHGPAPGAARQGVNARCRAAPGGVRSIFRCFPPSPRSDGGLIWEPRMLSAAHHQARAWRRVVFALTRDSADRCPRPAALLRPLPPFAVRGMPLRQGASCACAVQDIGWFDRDENSSGAIASRLSQDALNVKGAVGDQMGLILQNLVCAAATRSLSAPPTESGHP
jgi:ABC transporter transmembrane region